jgi:hypothetical protein
MHFQRLLEVVGAEPLFETGLLLAGPLDPAEVRRQLSRWVAAGRLLQLRRGLYALAEPYRRVDPHPFLVANVLVRGSYVSLQSALAHHGLIPEYVPVVTSVTTGRPGRRQTPLGTFDYRHIQPDRLGGFRHERLKEGQRADVATPAKALIDLVSLVPNADDRRFLEGLRLNLADDLDLGAPEWSTRPKLRRAFEHLTALQGEATDGMEIIR